MNDHFTLFWGTKKWHINRFYFLIFLSMFFVLVHVVPRPQVSQPVQLPSDQQAKPVIQPSNPLTQHQPRKASADQTDGAKDNDPPQR